MKPPLATVWPRLRVPTAILVIGLAVASYGVMLESSGWIMCNFKAFYCAAHVLATGGNPYKAAPLSACEAASSPAFFEPRDGLIVPAPLPGYAIAAIVPFSALTFPVAAVVWSCLLAICAALAIVLFARLGLGNVWAIAVALSIAVMGDGLMSGELEPIALLGIALAAWSASRPHPSVRSLAAMSCGLALAFAEPQIGIAAAIACAMLSRRGALVGAGVVAVLGLVSLVALGVHENVAYIRDVLPAQSSSELSAVAQFSLSWVLGRLGVTPGAALLAGHLQWIAMLGVTAWFARTMLARTNPEIAVLAGPAFVVVGGPYLHPDHIGLAIPAAMWIASRSLRPAWLFAVPLVALAVPLIIPIFMESSVPLPMVVITAASVAAFVGGEYGGSERAALYSAAAVAAALFVSAALLNVVGDNATTIAAPALSQAIPQASWAHFVASHVVTTWPVWLVKAPTWLGILATAGVLVMLALPRAVRLPERAYGQ